MSKAKRAQPLVQVIEQALAPGEFVSYGRSWGFVSRLETVKEQLDAVVKAGKAKQVVELYEVLLAGCHDKAGEFDDSGGNLGMFFQELFVAWITCIVAKRAISLLRVKDEVEVIGMPDEEECGHEMLITIRWEKDGLAVPLSQAKPYSDTDDQTSQAVAD